MSSVKTSGVKTGGNAGRLFCFGLGYTARALARSLRDGGWEVAGTAREGGDGLYCFDRGHPLDPAVLAGTTHLLVSIPPDEAGDPVVDAHGADLRNLPDLRWVGYLSTTGVYGDRGGDWVDETSELRPTGRRGRQRLAAERAWLDLGVPAHIFRLAGIYGPGRSALDSLRDGTARRIDKPGQVFSRTHVDDIVRVLRASMARPNPGAAYNVCDDNPAPAPDVIAYAAELLGVEPPPLIPFDEACLSPMAASFYADNKRVRNDRIKRELGVTLRWPDYRGALQAQLRQEKPASAGEKEEERSDEAGVHPRGAPGA